MMRPGIVLVCLVAWAVAGCATDQAARGGVTGGAKGAETPRYNLTGYSQAFKDGYAEACATPRKRNEQRFKTNTDYQMGWQDGSSVCRAR